MFQKIVVGVDGRAGGREALALARLLGGQDTEIVAVHVYAYERTPGRSSSASFEQVLREDARVVVERELAAAGVAGTAVVTGDLAVASGLDRIAVREQADLIVLGSTRHGALGGLLAGDTALATMHGAHSAVAVAPKGYEGPPPHAPQVLVAFDGSPEARAALLAARQVAAASGGRVHTLCCVEPPAAFGISGAYGFDWTEVAARRRADCRAALAETLCEDGDCATTSEVVIGLPGPAIADASREADLLVTGSRAHGAARRLLLGSTTARLLRTASCPLLVLPRGAIAPADAPTATLSATPS
jgi:nucleotide-binding universal stress UspA family protein